MSRPLLVAVFVSLLLHAGLVFGDRLFPSAPAPAPVIPDEIPVIEIQVAPPLEPEPPDALENPSELSPTSVADLAPPMQADLPSAVIDSPFVQKIQAPPPPGLDRSGATILIPPGPPVASPGGGGSFKILNLDDLDEKPRPIVRNPPITPFEMRRSGIQGEVVVEFIVDTSGNVRDPLIVRSSHPGFEQVSLDAVQRWKFKPGKKAGAPQNTRVRQALSFTLSGD